ncbi:unnamed protein product (macronuclear) [Paramecium tetraurelia]|uniref:GAF domain-containing protein n=1 Tax=Paramecium tetraurelia TaxID=5888 RepID=A0D047_PARTE|nr:uncharacterized protein GSPATT00011966001 [Paramecium tetraurelia]CAK76414.1 unnamed protein product [Paramecium tetraurelia]|eukprot:XP_001443811.1 hypothetical protein (macronuclear) [Paramecium tetraurelia strain d4-2]
MNKLEILNSPRLTTQTEHVKRSFYSKNEKNQETSWYHPRTQKNDGTCSPSNLQNETMLEQIRRLKDKIKLQQKEIERLSCINEYLIQANQAKLNILQSERQFHSKKVTIKLGHNKTLSEKKNYLNKFLDDTSQQSPSIKRRIYRNPTLARLHLEQESEQQKNEKQTQKASTFYDTLQQEDCFRTNAILNIQLSDEDALQQYKQDGTVSLMRELLDNEDSFGDIIQNMSAQKLSFLYDKFKRIMSDHHQLFILILRLKKIVMGALQMNSSILLDDALQTIINKCVDCLECDRASCFIVDESKKELWTKVAKGTSTTIRLQVGQGIAGFVAQSKSILNIEDAYRDQRFNSQQDIKNNYKTKTLLVCPIMENDKCVGVLQCVNKQSGYFTKDDEALLQIMCEFSRSVLKNAMNHDAQMLIQNKLRHLIKTGVLLQSKQNEVHTLIQQAEERLRSLMNVDFGKIIYNDMQTNKVIHINKEGKLDECDNSLGIMGNCIQSQSILAISNCYINPLFNPNIDIETNMPIICMPLKYSNQIIGALQVVNVKGIGGSDSKVNSIDLEMLELFCLQTTQCLIQMRSNKN